MQDGDAEHAKELGNEIWDVSLLFVSLKSVFVFCCRRRCCCCCYRRCCSCVCHLLPITRTRLCVEINDYINARSID